MKVLASAFFAFAVSASFSGCWSDSPRITGAVEILPELQGRITPRSALYIVARRTGERSGPPVAVRRYQAPLRFPLQFSISEEDVMIPNTPFEGQLVVTARLSLTGEATPVRVGDIESPAAPPAVEVGTKGMTIELKEVRN